MSHKPRIVVIGNGMVGHRFLEALIERGGAETYAVTTFCEEPRLAYDRVNLTQFFDGRTPTDLSLVGPGVYERAGIVVHVGDRAVAIDRSTKTVRSAKGERVEYDTLVLATGSAPFVPRVSGNNSQGCFVYRTIEDLEAIREFASRVKVGTVVGGGLLGLEAANALRKLGLETHVVELMPRLMAMQLDDAGGLVLRQRIEALGLFVHTGCATKEIVSLDGRVAQIRFEDGTALDTGMVVFSAGIRPRDELAREAGVAVGERGGIVVNEYCQTSDPDVYAAGECALVQGRVFGLVAPGYRMAEVVANRLMGAEATFTGFDMSTKLKLLGVDVASFGDAFAKTPGSRVMSVLDTSEGLYKKIVLSADRKSLLGGMLVGNAESYAALVQLMQNATELPPHPEDLILPAGRNKAGSGSTAIGVDSIPVKATICSCHNVTKETICGAICDQQLTTVGAIKSTTKAGTGCGSCVPLLTELLRAERKRAGGTLTNHLCEHFAYSRQELFHVVQVHKIHTFDDLIARRGTGLGCEICKPAVASILAATWNDYVLDDKHVALQDTNDRFLANLQRDGTYSVVPRVPGGEITPDQLIALGQVAKKYALYSKITGAQRVDLFGARLEQLPQIWSELIAAGFESGHAYAKALRAVKSCVGTTWCRFGQQDSVGMAIKLENRYKGMRGPHKIKAAASGCARECAEAQGKDFGVIATDKGYNLYVCGNGGMKPQHAQLLATDLDEATVIRYLDRFLMFYVRTADRLQRTATWLNNLEGGIEYIRQVVIEDSLGICADLEADMQHIVDTYHCEWKATLSNPERLKTFQPFINNLSGDDSIVFMRERDQHRPAFWDEKKDLLKEAV